MTFTEDLSAFFPDFGTDFVIGGSTVRGIFDHEYMEVNGMEGEHPVFRCAAADVASIAEGASAVGNDAHYLVKSKQPDGTGMIALLLELVTGIAAGGGFSTGFSSGFA